MLKVVTRLPTAMKGMNSPYKKKLGQGERAYPVEAAATGKAVRRREKVN